ncbi:hypothetical protein AF331_14550 [Rossellomorea marisflavi]|uniref:Uncharacterized protein n=1 Tax=Rossellomorea marisflavi TaxID=189381 RepID=A0A0M0G5N5_9BACI|nr:hypothetical protein AF331_14550 [Rossellomorea marisflavi]
MIETPQARGGSTCPPRKANPCSAKERTTFPPKASLRTTKPLILTRIRMIKNPAWHQEARHAPCGKQIPAAQRNGLPSQQGPQLELYLDDENPEGTRKHDMFPVEHRFYSKGTPRQPAGPSTATSQVLV